MRWFLNMKTGRKIGFGFGLVTAVALLVGWVAISRMAMITAISNEIGTAPLPGLGRIVDVVTSTKQYRIRQFRYLIADTPAQRHKLAAEMVTDAQAVSSALAEYEKGIRETDDRRNLAALRSTWERYISASGRVQELSDQGNRAAAAAVLNGPLADMFLQEVNPAVDKIVQWNKDRGATLAKRGDDTARSARTIMIGLLLFLAAFSLGIAWFVSRIVSQNLETLAGRLGTLQSICVTNLQKAIVAMESGDLTVPIETGTTPIEVKTKDDFGALAGTFNAMLEQIQSAIQSFRNSQAHLREVIGDILTQSQAVAATSSQLAAAANAAGSASAEIAAAIQDVANGAGQAATTSQEMARGAEQLARASTEAAAAMERLQQAIAQVQRGSATQREAAQNAETGAREAEKAVSGVASSAKQATAMAQQASAIAQASGKTVEDTVASMARIQELVQKSAERVEELGHKGQEIGAIVSTIEQIAEQTNLLALNAAIEAARAGEHGKGFAVVADEVRKLAERSASATKEIADLIGAVRNEVDAAVKAMAESSAEVTAGAKLSREAGSALGEILSSTQSVAQEAEQVTSVAEIMLKTMGKVLDAAEAVLRATDDNTQAVQEMAAGSDQVSGAITATASISEESAAGAEEVSAAAEEVSASAQNVSATIEEQTAGIEEISAATAELDKQAARVAELVSEFKLGAGAGLQGQIAVMKRAHEKWVQRVEAMVSDGKLIRREEIVSHHDCGLGKWYYSIGKREHGSEAAFQELESPHARFHVLVGEAVDAMASGNTRKAQTTLTEIKALADQILRLLDAIAFGSQRTEGAQRLRMAA